MTHHKSKYANSRRAGFVLIEALIALLLISVGLLAVSRLQVLSISGSGEAKQYSSAMAISQRKLEDLRNILLRSQFAIVGGNEAVAGLAGDNATYNLVWTVTPNPVLATTEQLVLRLTTNWTDRNGVAKSIDLNSVIAWDDPGARVNAASGGALPQLVSPTGDALRGTGDVRPTTSGTLNPDGRTRTWVNGDVTELLNASTGRVLLYLPPRLVNGIPTPQSFATISGKVFFDQNAPNNTIPSSSNVRLRLSSEGECIFTNGNGALLPQGAPLSAGTNSYKYFTYTCYVGTGWYGNVGVVVDGSVTGQAGDPTICVGDPNFNSGMSDNTLISPHSVVSSTRSYRGFKGSPGAYFSTGMKDGTKYGTQFDTAGVAVTIVVGDPPIAGYPRPTSYPSSYPSVPVATPPDAADHFDQNFLVTHLQGAETCAGRMVGGAFAKNAGKYFCIAPDKDTADADVCPSIWPNFESQVGSGTGIVLTVIPAGAGTGTVTSTPAGINCGATCLASFTAGSSVSLTAAATGASLFTGWSGGGCSGTGACVVTLTAATSVTATFVSTATYALTVTPAGNGTGTVTSSPAGISCGTTCSATYASGTVVTLAASPTAGSSFTGWTSGPCTGTGDCTVTISAATAVTATFDIAAASSLTVSRAGAGTGTVSSSPAGIDCGSTCSFVFTSGTAVSLTASPTAGSIFVGWGGECSGAGPCVVTVTAAHSVTATFAPPAVTYPITVTRVGTGTGTVSSSPGGINCGVTCSASFAAGSSVTLTATATSGTFGGWSGSGCSGIGTCTVASLSAAAAVTATFGACNTTVTGAAKDKFGSVTVTPSSAGVCNMQSGTAGFDCTLSAIAGTNIVLTNVRTGGAGYSYPKTIVATCSPQTLNFP